MSDYIITCDDETASWVGNDVESMRKIVRCKDCESYQPGMYIHFTCEYLHQWAKPDDFCCWGERKQ